MGFWENQTTFAGKPVEDWSGSDGDFDRVAYRISVGWDDDETIDEKFESILEAEGSHHLDTLVIGAWQGDDSGADPEGLIERLVAAREKLPNLKHLFFGDITSEQNEISWIIQTDFSPLLNAYPKLETLVVRGTNELSFGSIAHDHLRTLIIQSGGLDSQVIAEVATAKLPSLEHLELWLGESGYGGDATVEDLAPFLTGKRFPKLRYLGLKNSEMQDEIAGVVAASPVLDQLETLDLSQGTLGDEGARSLIQSPGVKKLKKLILAHHFISPELQEELKKLGPDVDVSDLKEPHEWGGEQHRYNAVGE
jgi:hypothetical protein